jgi:hypothetical protein
MFDSLRDLQVLLILVCICLDAWMVLQVHNSKKPSPRSYQEAACLVAAQALVPSSAAGAAGESMQVVLSVRNPRVILVRRFLNNVLYVMALVSHELDAAGSAQEQHAQGHRTQAAQAQRQPSQQQQQQQQASSGAAVFLLTLTGVQVGQT